MERLDVVVTAIYFGDRLLLTRNRHWGFTLPMTKLHQTQLGLTGAALTWELGEEAAMRNVAECLHLSTMQEPRLLADVGDVMQSDRSGRVNHYEFHVYGFEVSAPEAPPGVVGQWLSCEEILDDRRRPISKTARQLVGHLAEIGLNRGGFPPECRPPRDSVASIALIRRDGKRQVEWLSQWNERWQRYFLVGGHNEGESPAACMRRELDEELGTVRGERVGFQLAGDYEMDAPRPLTPYTDWSVGYWQETNYRQTLFNVRPTPAGHEKIAGHSANRWLLRDEIASDRCIDGKAISPTTRRILRKAGAV